MTLVEVMERTYESRSGQPGYKQVVAAYKAAFKFMVAELEAMGKNEDELAEFNDWEWAKYLIRLNVHSSAGLFKKCYNMLYDWYEENGRPGNGFPPRCGLGYLKSREEEFRGQTKMPKVSRYQRDPNFFVPSEEIQAELDLGLVKREIKKDGTQTNNLEGYSVVDQLRESGRRRREALRESREGDGLDRADESGDGEVGDGLRASGGEREEPESGRGESGGGGNVAGDWEADEYGGDSGDHEDGQGCDASDRGCGTTQCDSKSRSGGAEWGNDEDSGRG